MNKIQITWATKNLSGLSWKQFNDKYGCWKKKDNKKFYQLVSWWGDLNVKPDKPTKSNQKNQVNEDQQAGEAEKKSTGMVATVDYARKFKKGLKGLIVKHLHENYPDTVHKGELGRLAINEWGYSNENMGRRCRELETDGVIERIWDKKNRATYKIKI